MNMANFLIPHTIKSPFVSEATKVESSGFSRTTTVAVGTKHHQDEEYTYYAFFSNFLIVVIELGMERV